MQQRNVPQFISLLKERNFPIDGMQMEVATLTPNGTDGFKGVLTMEGEDSFSLTWCKWECFLLLLSALEWNYLLKYLIPYCCGFVTLPLYKVESEMGRKLQVMRSIKYA
jgi:hypothetical protein